MSILPYRKFTLSTKLKKTEVLAAILENEHFAPCAGTKLTPDLLKNDLNQKSKFKIKPRISYRNSFVPIFICKFCEDELSNTKMDIVMRPRAFTYLFILFFMLFLIAPTIQTITSFIQSGILVEGGVISSALLIYAILLLFVGFGVEVPKKKKLFLEMLRAEEI